MSILVQHDGSSPELDATLALVAALMNGQQGQSAPPPQPSSPEQQPLPSPITDILAQLAPAARVNGSAPQNPYAAGDVAVNGHSRQPSYATYGGGGHAGTASGYDRFANQDALAQYRAQQQDRRLGEREQQQAEMEAMRSADMMSREQAHDPPQWIQQGLTQGSLKYSEAQKRELQDLQDSIVKVRSDPTWSPAQRAQLESRQRERIRQIQLSPQEVPWNERPVPPDQAYQSQLIMRPVQIDENTTLQLPVVPHMRNGQVEYRLSPEGEVQAKIAQEKIKHQNALAIKQMELDARAETAKAAEAAKAGKEKEQHQKYLTGRKDRLSKDMHKAYEALRQSEATWNAIKSGDKPKDAKGNPIDYPPEQASQEFRDAQNHYSMIQQEIASIDQEMSGLDSQPAASADLSGEAQPIPSQVGPPPQQPPQPPVDESGRVIVDSEADGSRYNLPDGTPVIDSQGRTGTWHNYTSVTSREELSALPPGNKFILPDGRTGTRQYLNNSLPSVSTAADYSALPSGAQFYDPQGNLRTKR
jgi:hypothetical protein